jgi:hypothetical protein
MPRADWLIWTERGRRTRHLQGNQDARACGAVRIFAKELSDRDGARYPNCQWTRSKSNRSIFRDVQAADDSASDRRVGPAKPPCQGKAGDRGEELRAHQQPESRSEVLAGMGCHGGSHEHRHQARDDIADAVDDTVGAADGSGLCDMLHQSGDRGRLKAPRLSLLFGGTISQRIGRRTYLLVASATAATLGTLRYYLLLNTAPGDLPRIVLLTTVTKVLVVAPGALGTVYINERFNTAVRASGFGLGYSLAIILPEFYVVYQTWLAYLMPFKYTVLVLVVIRALFIFVGAA